MYIYFISYRCQTAEPVTRLDLPPADFVGTFHHWTPLHHLPPGSQCVSGWQEMHLWFTTHQCTLKLIRQTNAGMPETSEWDQHYQELCTTFTSGNTKPIRNFRDIIFKYLLTKNSHSILLFTETVNKWCMIIFFFYIYKTFYCFCNISSIIKTNYDKNLNPWQRLFSNQPCTSYTPAHISI